jgi:hypothetical protein
MRSIITLPSSGSGWWHSSCERCSANQCSYIAVVTVFRALAQRGISWEAWSPNSIPLILGIVLQLALVRLLLEVAVFIISSHRRDN